MKFLAKFLVIIFIFSPFITFADQKTPEHEHYFLTVADIHFDPFISCEKAPRPCPLLDSLEKANYKEWDSIFEKSGNQQLSEIYQDTNYALLKSTLDQLKYVYEQNHPDFVLVLGDFLAHKFDSKFRHFSRDRSRTAYRSFIKKTMAYLAYKLRNTFPNDDIYPVIGNNDSYTGDYSVIPNGAFLKDTGFIWSELILNKENRQSFLETFSNAGYYIVTVPNQPDHKIIILNSVIFSDNPKSKSQKKAASEQLEWLQDELADIKETKNKVMVAFHIPVSFDMFPGVKSDFAAKEFWEPIYIHEFENDLKQNSFNIVSILPAHIHIEVKSRIILKQFADVPVDFTPSISPIFGNDPGFKLFTYDPDSFQIKTIHTYYFPLRDSQPDWHKEYGLLKLWPKFDKIIV